MSVLFVCFRTKQASYLEELARDNTQLLLNKLWKVNLYIAGKVNQV